MSRVTHLTYRKETQITVKTPSEPQRNDALMTMMKIPAKKTIYGSNKTVETGGKKVVWRIPTRLPRRFSPSTITQTERSLYCIAPRVLIPPSDTHATHPYT